MSEMLQRLGTAIEKAIAEGKSSSEVACEALEEMRNPTQGMIDSPSYQQGDWSRLNLDAWIAAAKIH